jgi:hypothetical protein
MIQRKQTQTAVFALVMMLSGLLHAADAPAGRTLRVLKIGNSFSQNATEFLPDLAKSQGHTLILGRAEIGGCSLQKHWELAEKFEANPDDPDGKPYSKMSLKQMLLSDKWDIVTIQQHSLAAPDLSTYQPYANKLAEYIRKHAPQAKIWIHETWAYRSDDKMFKDKKTQAQMYQNIHEAYEKIAKDIQAERIMPVATAFQNVRKDPRYQPELEMDVDPKAFTYPKLPKQVHELCVGWSWDTKTKPPTLRFDPKHATTAGKYLGALVWHETLLGEVKLPAFVPPDLPAADAEVLQEIARKTVRDGLKP